MRIRIFIYSLIVLLSMACTVSKNKYMEKYKSGPFIQTADNQFQTVSMRFVPKGIRGISSFKNATLGDTAIQMLLNDSSNEREFLLELAINNFNDEFLKFDSNGLSYEQKVEYYSFDFKHDIEVYLDGVKCEIKEMTFERNFGLTPKGTFNLNINIPISVSRVRFEIHDTVNDSEMQVIEFNNKELNSLPKLKKVKKWQK